MQLTVINGEGTEHDIVFPNQDTKSPRVNGRGASTTIVFRATKSGDFIYFCGVPGHQLAGMQGQFLVTPMPAAQTLVEADISREPTDLPPPIGKRDPKTVRLDLFTVEQEGRLAEATTFGYWTFNGKVPGPFVRVRVGDTVDVHLKNPADSNMIHSVDFHAATGPGGGAAALQVDPGGEKSMTFKALIPGLYVYHCATPMVAEHIANGMYGMILVEPETGLAPVDHEFYVMQGEIYTEAAFGQHGSQEFSVEKLLNERPEYFVFNGSVGAISKLHPLHAKVGETVRLFFGVGGPHEPNAGRHSDRHGGAWWRCHHRVQTSRAGKLHDRRSCIGPRRARACRSFGRRGCAKSGYLQRHRDARHGALNRYVSPTCVNR